ncbi:crossover junction endonuclease EME1 isoform X2 [Cylas formicarius]|uniref:crossover junction endonuclease EME1 isoform X2 n=1 Tax=Cylas formicarius TaxID=197179 RepID=UPI0029588E50|nr:crossover junction endonuclease EME1 isoform X2 [Cylas formicarius]
MDGFVEILSDSSDSSKTVDIDDEVISKFVSPFSETQQAAGSHIKDKRFYELDLSDDDFIYEPVESEVKEDVRSEFAIDDFTDNVDDVLNRSSRTNSQHSSNGGGSQHEYCGAGVENNLSSQQISKPRKKNRKKLASLEKGRLLAEKELRKAEKIKERERKKEQKEQERAMKKAARVIETCIKPDQCGQYITAEIDENLSKKSYGPAIVAALTTGGYKYVIDRQSVPNGIRWIRNVPGLNDSVQNEKYYLLVLDLSEFLELVVDRTLVGHVHSLLALPNIRHVTIAVLNLDKYYSQLKAEQNREFKAAILGSQTIRNPVLPQVNRKDLELALVELQVLCRNCYFKSVNSYEELGIFVAECTKAVSQAPYKAEKARKIQQEDEFLEGHNRDCVKVDANGNGLRRLWGQVLKMFPLASLETSEAIMSHYPTLNSLLKAYESCETREAKEKLLQDIPVRRNAGSITAARKIGPELSRRAYIFFCHESNLEI